MEELRISERPALRRPVLVAAFRGWNDGGQGATLAAGHLAQAWDATRFAEIDPEGFFDFQATRPHVSLVDGLSRRIDWPENAFYYAPRPDAERDVVLLIGIEPNLRWRTFTTLIVDLARELGVDMLITLGSLLADVPHTRPSPVTGAGRVCGTSASSAPSVTTSSTPSSRAKSVITVANVRQRRFGSIPSSRTASRSSPSGRAW